MKDSLTFEPFVYTSVASHFVNGYQSVVIGKELNTHTETIETIYELSQALCQQGYRDKTESLGIVVGNHFCFLEIRRLEKDWMGRPGAYVTGQACKLAELFKTSTRSAFAIPWEKLQFISHEEALRTIKKDQNRFEQTIFLPGKEISVQDALLHQNDHDWMRKNTAPLVTTLEAVTQKEMAQIGADVAGDSERFGRCLMALIPSKRRLLSFAVSVTENDLSILQEFSLRPHLLFNSQGVGRLSQPRPIRSDSSPDTRAMQSALEWFREFLFKYDLDYEAEIDAVDRVCQIQQKSTKDYWKTIIEERHVREAGKFEYAITLYPNECVRRWTELLQRYKKDTDSILSDDAVYQMANGHTEWLSKVLVNLDEGGTKDLNQTIDKCLQDSFLKKWQANEDQLTSIRNIFDQLGQDDGPYHAYWPICQAILENKNQNPSDSELEVICDAHADGDVWTALLSRTVDGDGKSDRFVSQLVSLPSFQRTSAAWARYLSEPSKAKIVNAALQSQDANIRQWCYNDENLRESINPNIVNVEKIAVKDAEVKEFIRARQPTPNELIQWWRSWKPSDKPGKRILTKSLYAKLDKLNPDLLIELLQSDGTATSDAPIENIIHYIFTNLAKDSYNNLSAKELSSQLDVFYKQCTSLISIMERVLSGFQNNQVGARNLFLKACVSSDLAEIRKWSYRQDGIKTTANTLFFEDLKARGPEFANFADHCLNAANKLRLWRECPEELPFEKKKLWSRLTEPSEMSQMAIEQQKEIFNQVFKLWLNDEESPLLSVLEGMLLSEHITSKGFEVVASCFNRVVSNCKNGKDLLELLKVRLESSAHIKRLILIALSCDYETAREWGWSNLPAFEERVRLWKQFPINRIKGPERLWKAIIQKVESSNHRQDKIIKDLLQFIAHKKNVDLGYRAKKDILYLVGRLANSTRINKRSKGEWHEIIYLLTYLSPVTGIQLEELHIRFLSQLGESFRHGLIKAIRKFGDPRIKRWVKSTQEYKNIRKERTRKIILMALIIILLFLIVWLSHLTKWPPFIWQQSDNNTSEQKADPTKQDTRLQEYKGDKSQNPGRSNGSKKYNHKR